MGGGGCRLGGTVGGTGEINTVGRWGLQLPHESLCEGAQVLASSRLSFLSYYELFGLDYMSRALPAIKCSDSIL